MHKLKDFFASEQADIERKLLFKLLILKIGLDGKERTAWRRSKRFIIEQY